jgi:hypothetical protein
MSYRHAIYETVRLGTPGSDQAAQIGVLDYANSETVTMTGSAVSATALPAGCFLASIQNPGSNLVRYRADGSAATVDSPVIPAGAVVDIVVPGATRVISLLGTNTDVITVTPYLVVGL